jgi:hypothetical protein
MTERDVKSDQSLFSKTVLFIKESGWQTNIKKTEEESRSGLMEADTTDFGEKTWPMDMVD